VRGSEGMTTKQKKALSTHDNTKKHSPKTKAMHDGKKAISMVRDDETDKTMLITKQKKKSTHDCTKKHSTQNKSDKAAFLWFVTRNRQNYSKPSKKSLQKGKKHNADTRRRRAISEF
jgi:DsbC/DsbD-like thiol-disulfide interchange protein